VTIEILRQALQDLEDGSLFYERLKAGLGEYFLDCLLTDIDSLRVSGGVHPLVAGYRRALSRKFPFAIYYRMVDQRISVYAVLDCRQEPISTRKRLSKNQ
jgi:hypothetical protein